MLVKKDQMNCSNIITQMNMIIYEKRQGCTINDLNV